MSKPDKKAANQKPGKIVLLPVEQIELRQQCSQFFHRLSYPVEVLGLIYPLGVAQQDVCFRAVNHKIYQNITSSAANIWPAYPTAVCAGSSSPTTVIAAVTALRVMSCSIRVTNPSMFRPQLL